MAPNPLGTLGISIDYLSESPSITAVCGWDKGYFVGYEEQRFTFEVTAIYSDEAILGPKMLVRWGD